VRIYSRAAEHEKLPATESVDSEEGNEAGEELPGEAAAREDA
jgi:hypothetical protein